MMNQPKADVPEPMRKPHLALRVMMMPKDTNVHGTIFGGVLLSHMDQAGVIGAAHAIAQAGWPVPPLVTVAMDQVEFHHAVLVGDVVSLWTEVVRLGRTSITVQLRVETERDGKALTVTQARITYVAVDLQSRPRRPIPIRPERRSV